MCSGVRMGSSGQVREAKAARVGSPLVSRDAKNDRLKARVGSLLREINRLSERG